MLVAIPHIKFIKGIPAALEQDSFVDVNKWNLNLSDDQLIDTSRYKSTVNLFTRDSRHQNLRVMYIVQNLFNQGKGTHSISLRVVVRENRAKS